MYHIGDFEYDELTQTLTSPDKQTIEVRDQLARLLQALLDANGELTPTKELEVKVWGSNTVSDATVKAEITALRKLFGEFGTTFVKNVRSRGYYLNTTIRKIDDESPVVPDTPAVDNDIKKQSFLTKGKAMVVTVVLTLFTTLTISLSSGLTSSPIDSNPTSPRVPKIKNLTFIEGQEMTPSLSPDGGYLAFTHTRDANLMLQVKVKDLTSNKSTTFEHAFSAGPNWDSYGKYIYYSTHENGACTIVRREHFGNLVFSDPEDIADCGSERQGLAPVVDNRDEWIYFNYKPSMESPFVIKRKHLKSGMEQQITLSTDSSYGDYSLALSPDSKMLAFLSSDANSVHRLRMMELETGNIKELRQFNQAIFNVTWDKESQNVFFIDRQTIKGLNVGSELFYDVYTLPRRGRSLTYVDKDSFLVSLGGFYSGNLVEWDVEREFNLERVHNSSFNDSNASGIPGTKDYVFVSDRTGDQQVWYLTEDGVFQVSDFTNKEIVTDIDVSTSGDTVLLLVDGTLYTRSIEMDRAPYQAHAMDFIIKNPVWSCDEGSVIYMSVKLNGTWHLAKFDLTDESVVTISPGVTGINADCKTSEYYVTREGIKGVFSIDVTSGDVSEEPLVSGIGFSEREEWAVLENELYYVNNGIVYNRPFHSDEPTKLTQGKNRVTQISLNDGRLLFIQKTLEDSHISILSP